MDTERLM